MSTIVCKILTGVSVLLFVTSLTQDGFYIDRPNNPRAWAPCIGLLLVGWIAVFNGVLAWLANPVLAATWFLMSFRSTRGIALGCAVVALGLSLSFLLHREIMTSEAGHYSKITGYGLGYWLWIASIIVALIGCIFGVW
jgi:hypothetical protein